MTLTHNIILLFSFCVTNIWAHSKDLNKGDYEMKLLNNNDVSLSLFKNLRAPEKVDIQVYYECLCPGSIYFNVNLLNPVILTMGSSLDIKTYPFGNAKIIDDNGKVEIKCQHGPAECYGNKLHACALDKLQHTTALLYNICLMNATDGPGSDDIDADRCGKSMNVDSEPIKECAKGARGKELLRHYGEESKKAKFYYVPYVLINGKEFQGDNFKKAVCDAFIKPPPACQ